MNPFEMVVVIILIVTIGRVVQSRYRGRKDDGGLSTAENHRLRDEVRALKERVAVLERVVTDESGPRRLDREIEALRSRDA